MKILISGSTGLVAKYLMPKLLEEGHEIFKLVRKTPQAENEIQWDSERGFMEAEHARLEGFDAVIHLAGDNIASEKWTKEKKLRLRNSRVNGTKILVEALKKCQNPPRIFISASAEGFYGRETGDEIVTEDSPNGKGFLAELCRDWENEIERAKEFGARVVTLRIAVVFSKEGGALEKILVPFKLGVGGRLGSGKQWMPWLMIDDLVEIVNFTLNNEVAGVFNASSPNPVTNAEFTETLGKVLHRPAAFSIPGFAVKMLFGEMGDQLLLKGCRVMPKRLLESGFKFKYDNLEEALKDIVY